LAFDKPIELVGLQQHIQPRVERMPRRLWQLRGRDPQRRLLTLSGSHRHAPQCSRANRFWRSNRLRLSPRAARVGRRDLAVRGHWRVPSERQRLGEGLVRVDAKLSLLKTWFAPRQPSVETTSPCPSGYARPSRFAKEFGPGQVLRSDKVRPLAR